MEPTLTTQRSWELGLLPVTVRMSVGTQLDGEGGDS